mmetsp:Transcript_26150/g.83515  ORF Transcript_26150/g.83515 Transcript_26150/m.83515 type:complete len:87 (-) Transcript_26150:153-413(-)
MADPPPAPELDQLARAVKKDFGDRAGLQELQASVHKITDFLSAFDALSRERIQEMSQRLKRVERQVDLLEAAVAGRRGAGHNRGED